MAALHQALRNLGPILYDTVPTSDAELKTFLQQTFANSQLLIDSVPPPAPDASTPVTARSRANTTASIASNVSEVSASSARSDPPIPDHLALQKEWGKPIKLSAKDNPMGMAVYRLAGKDGRGAWFARRSVHEGGMGFDQWKAGLQHEFPESLKVQGGPGTGNVRGIGGEKRVDRKEVEGVGCMEVYHLSAQFPGPTTPRDFVTLLLTSSAALTHPSSLVSQARERERGLPRFSDYPRHYMVISKPCKHPECPERPGFIRGQYESIEFIREIPLKPKKSASSTDLLNSRRANGRAQHDRRQSKSFGMSHSAGSDTDLRSSSRPGITRRPSSADGRISTDGRPRGKTISFAESRGTKAKGESFDVRSEDSDDDVEENPVEWVMITRSDPGGSVPRFMVERGTPSAIVADGLKFVDWCTKRKRFSIEEAGPELEEVMAAGSGKRNSLAAYETNGHLAGLNGASDSSFSEATTQEGASQNGTADPPPILKPTLFSTLSSAAYAYAPQAVLDRLPSQNNTPQTATFSNTPTTAVPVAEPPPLSRSPSASSTLSSLSFASADSHLSTPSTKSTAALSTASKTASASTGSKVAGRQTAQEKEAAKLEARKRKLDEKLHRSREKELKDKATPTEKEKERIRKAEEKHARETKRVEERHDKEVANLERRKVREGKKEEEREKRRKEKDERSKIERQRDEAVKELEKMRRERDALKGLVGELQKRQTELVARAGRAGVDVTRLGADVGEGEGAGLK